MFWSKKISFCECRDYLLLNLKQLDYNKTNETTNSIQFKIINKNRTVTLDMFYSNGKVVVDVSDSYYLLRIPKEYFNDIDKYKKFIVSIIGKIYNEFGIDSV